MKAYKPTDATTNPSLILSAAGLEQYKPLVEKAVHYGVNINGLTQQERTDEALDMLTVLIGCEILKIVPGRVSTEIDARFSFNVEKSVEKAIKLIGMYKKQGIAKERILIKLAATWEGIEAAR